MIGPSGVFPPARQMRPTTIMPCLTHDYNNVKEIARGGFSMLSLAKTRIAKIFGISSALHFLFLCVIHCECRCLVEYHSRPRTFFPNYFLHD